MLREKMKLFLLFAILFLTLFGSSSATGNLSKEGVNVISNAEESFLRRYTINEDFRNMNATIEVYLTSIDMLVSVRLDTRNRITSVTTTYLPGKTDPNEAEPERTKETETNKEKIYTDQAQETSHSGVSLPKPKTAQNQQIIPKESSGSSSSWFHDLWDGFSNAVQILIRWLYIGIEWPKELNEDKFARRTITKADLTCPADGSVNHSFFNLDITDDMEGNSCPVTRNIPPMILPGSNSNSLHKKSQNVGASENSDITTNQTTNKTADEKENEPSKRRESFVVFIGHYENEFEEFPELRPEFAPVDYYGSNPEMLSTSPLPKEYDDDLSPDGQDIIDLEQDDDYIYWPETIPEFANVGYYGVSPPETASGNHADYTCNAETKSDGIPTMKYNESSEPLREDNYSKLEDESWLSENSDIGTSALLDESNKPAPMDAEAWPHPFDACNADVTATSTMAEILANGTMDQGELMCSNQPVGVRYWMRQERDNGICESVDLGVDRQLKVPPVKNRNDKWMAKIVVNESVMCPLGSKPDQETEICPNKDAKPSPASPWLITKLWNSCTGYLPWRKSNDAPRQSTKMADIPINIMEVCMASSNKTGPETKFCTKKLKDAKHTPTSSWRITKLWNSCTGYLPWRKSNDVPRQNKRMEDIPINIMEICMAGSNKTGPETKFCTKKYANFYKPTTASPWLITRLWKSCVSYVRWRESSGVPLQATRFDNPQDKWLTEVPINESLFCPKEPERPADSPWFTTRLWNKGVDTVRWITSNETQENARNLTYYCWKSFKITMINWTWQNTFDVIIIIWTTDYCFVALCLTTGYSKEIIQLLRKRREIRRLELEEEERERQLRERELELARERANRPKPIWRPKPPKKKRSNYCGKLQNWN